MEECILNAHTIAHALSVIYSKKLGRKVTFVLSPKDGIGTSEEPETKDTSTN